jgi:hypothetical protein
VVLIETLIIIKIIMTSHVSLYRGLRDVNISVYRAYLSSWKAGMLRAQCTDRNNNLDALSQI